MRMRWNKDGDWLQFRTTTYYDDRRKEVPNRRMRHWEGMRRQQGALTLDDLVEIAQLPDVQLDAVDMAEGARKCWGLVEWDLARNKNLRPHLHYLAGFTVAERQMAMSPAGMPFVRMSPPQQQRCPVKPPGAWDVVVLRWWSGRRIAPAAETCPHPMIPAWIVTGASCGHHGRAARPEGAPLRVGVGANARPHRVLELALSLSERLREG
jgi:hypothetical protein